MSVELCTPELEMLDESRRTAAGAVGIIAGLCLAYVNAPDFLPQKEIIDYVRFGCAVEIGILSTVAASSTIVAWRLSGGLGPMERPEGRPHDPPRRPRTTD